jgi:hypothetical protein
MLLCAFVFSLVFVILSILYNHVAFIFMPQHLTAIGKDDTMLGMIAIFQTQIIIPIIEQQR